MPTKLRQVLPYVVTLAAAAWLYWVASRIQADTGGRISPSAWPKAIIAFMALLCVYEIGKRLLNRGQTSVIEQRNDAVSPNENRGLTPVLGGIGLIAVYVALVPFVGFFLSTALFLWTFPLLGGMRRPGFVAVVSLAGTLSLAFIFLKVAYISLPLGVGPFRQLSIGLMRVLGVS